MSDLSAGCDLGQVFRPFAGPHLPMAEDLAAFVVTRHAAAQLALFLQCHRQALRSANAELARFLEQAAAAPLAFEACWRPSFGLLESYLQQGVGNPAALERLAVSLAWDLTLAGCAGAWSSSAAPMNALLAGGQVLPESRRIAVESDGRLLAVALEGQAAGERRHYRFDIAPAPGAPWEPAGDLEACRQVEGTLLLTAGLERSHSYRSLADALLPAAEIELAVAKHLEGMALLRRYAPEYADWVSRVIRAVIPLKSGNGKINSGSSRSEPGVIHATIDCSAEGYAEMLVHEASHQYYYILRRLGGLEDGSDPTLYYSPVKQTGRPIAMVLLAYHAFANVVLMGRRATRAGFPAEGAYFPQNEAFLLPILERLRQGLVATPALTALGRALWEPLDARLSAT